MADWSVAEAKEGFSKVVHATRSEPRRILNRGRPVAAVVGVELFEEFIAWQESRRRRSIAGRFEELRSLLGEEGYTFDLPERADRPNTFAEIVDELPG